MNNTKDRLYRIWHNMKSRCYLETFPRYRYYGARGITVCEEWRNSFSAFHEWATSNGYRDDLQIDRIDNDGNYEPSNCRWVTKREQESNKSTNVYVSYKGEEKTVAEWARVFNIDRCLLGIRLRRGWSFERAVSTPPRAHHCR